MRASFPVAVKTAPGSGTPARCTPAERDSARGPGSSAALGRLAALETQAQRELSCMPRMRIADVPERDELLAILVAWDLAL